MITVPKIHLFLQEGLSAAQAERAREMISGNPARMTPLMMASVLRRLEGIAPVRCALCRRRECAQDNVAEIERGAVLS